MKVLTIFPITGLFTASLMGYCWMAIDPSMTASISAILQSNVSTRSVSLHHSESYQPNTIQR